MSHIIKETVRRLRKNQTNSEKILWNELRNRKLLGSKFVRQYPFTYSYYNQNRFFVVDFYCVELKLAIEIDGNSYNGKETLDKIRENILQHKGIHFIRFTVSDVENRYYETIEKICNMIQVLREK